ncbi:hypothetical protein AJ80_02935 [Polytolypa hystricis UAMH7299]|uniref:Uncharacterized protein n=1 Tax=Polytolypa hystricis (strain UAMH7299) TaxID=1447883 RepID=A0A2B7YPA5_POLH7|nr:hypothetical protein AJ80_02935 [Polytolypa hystricis UAMH7299]
MILIFAFGERIVHITLHSLENLLTHTATGNITGVSVRGHWTGHSPLRSSSCHDHQLTTTTTTTPVTRSSTQTGIFSGSWAGCVFADKPTSRALTSFTARIGSSLRIAVELLWDMEPFREGGALLSVDMNMNMQGFVSLLDKLPLILPNLKFLYLSL